MKTKTVIEAHEEIERLAKENAVQEVRRIQSIEIGKVIRQGDIYLHRVDEKHTRGKKLKSRQLALGNTMGSRHIAESPAKVFEGTTLPGWCDQRTFLGPLVESKKRFTVTHPEHAHVDVPAGCYQITHQTDARTMERVQD
jgi:hypothetical protein